MVQNTSYPSPGDDGVEPFAENPPPAGIDAHAVLIRVAPVLKYHAYKFAGNDRELRRDLLQEGAGAVIRAVGEYKPGIGKLDGYAAQQSVDRMWTVCRQHRRRHKRITYRNPHPSENEPGFDPIDPTTERCVSCAADYARVRELIPQVLSRREQEVILARFFGHLKVSEAARALHLSKGRVSQLESAAITKLRFALEHADPTLN